jgi:hypothetical protein
VRYQEERIVLHGVRDLRNLKEIDPGIFFFNGRGRGGSGNAEEDRKKEGRGTKGSSGGETEREGWSSPVDE